MDAPAAADAPTAAAQLPSVDRDVFGGLAAAVGNGFANNGFANPFAVIIAGSPVAAGGALIRLTTSMFVVPK
ncbi:hypothetical protein H4S00_005079 [Coemansia sp. D1744]|nr:hypothetical protein H4S00_005079 [Coemansia sp. D1744]